MIRTRFAPSPTGYLHVGGLRTALYSYLFAKNQGGKFLLRIEDTDRERFVADGTQNIINSLQWAGIVPDEGVVNFKLDKLVQKGDKGPYIQSERLDIYKKFADELVEAGNAYHCFCTPERLQELRDTQQKNKQPTGYDQHCLKTMPIDEAKKRARDGEKNVIRLKMPKTGETVFNDLIRGPVTFQNKLVDDQVEASARRDPVEGGEAKDHRHRSRAGCLIDEELLGGDLRLGVERLRGERGLLGDWGPIGREAVVAIGGAKHKARHPGLGGRVIDAPGALVVIAPGHLRAHRLAGREADDRRQVDDRVEAGRGQAADGEAIGAGPEQGRVADIGLHKAEARVVPVAEQRRAAEEQVVGDRHRPAGVEQHAGQQRTDIAGPAGDQHVGRARIAHRVTSVLCVGCAAHTL